MKKTQWMLGLCVAGVAAFGGCSRKAENLPAWEIRGVQVDMPQLDVVFVNASQEVQGNVAMFKRYFRYGQYPQALVELQKLANQPSLTEPQKKLVSDLTEQTKQVLAKAVDSTQAR